MFMKTQNTKMLKVLKVFDNMMTDMEANKKIIKKVL